MNIIVCNDTRTESFPEEFDWTSPDAAREAANQRVSVNLDATLIARLRRNGNQVWLFDGYQPDAVTKIRSPEQSGAILANLIVTTQADGMVFDLNYFGDFNYGITMLKQLQRMAVIPAEMRLIVYSRFVREPEGDYPRRLVDECNIPHRNVVDRNLRQIDFIVERFQ